MIKSAIALAAAAPLMAAPALAGPYVNVEDPTQVGLAMTTPEQPLTFIWATKVKLVPLHTMFKVDPAIVATDGAENSTRFSGKAGFGIPVSDAVGVYGELSFITAEDEFMDDLGVGGKLGVKYNF